METSITNFDPLLQEKLSHQRISLQTKLNAITSLNDKTLELVDGEESFHDEVPNQITRSIVKTDSKLESGLVPRKPFQILRLSLQALLEIPQMFTRASGVNSDSENGVRARLPKLEMKRLNGKPTEL